MANWLIEQAEYRTTKNDKPYLWIQGNSGERRLPLYIWNAPKNMDLPPFKGLVLSLFKEQDKGDFISASWKDAVVIPLSSLDASSPLHSIKLKGSVTSEDLIKRCHLMVDKLDISDLWKQFIFSEEVEKELLKYDKFAAGAKAHHPWINGLSTHTEEALTAFMHLSKAYYLKGIKHHVCFIAILFHDWGKTKEYKSPLWDYTDNMFLFGHIYLSARKVEELFNQFIDRNNLQVSEQDTRDLEFIQHAILAHHGVKEYGSPVVPATIEAQIVHMCDAISAKNFMFINSMHMEKNFFLGTTVVKE